MRTTGLPTSLRYSETVYVALAAPLHSAYCFPANRLHYTWPLLLCQSLSLKGRPMVREVVFPILPAIRLATLKLRFVFFASLSPLNEGIDNIYFCFVSFHVLHLCSI